jgi:hypothetical protein
MGTPTRSELRSRNALELGVLHDIFNKQLAGMKPFSAGWCRVAAAIDAIQSERRGRLERPWHSAAKTAPGRHAASVKVLAASCCKPWR